MSSDDMPVGNTYDKYSATHPIERRLIHNFLATLDTLLPPSASRILEIGAGEGEIVERLRDRYRGASVIGLDLLDLALVEQWRARDLEMVVGDAQLLPFADRSFDLVVAVEVLEHVHRPACVVRELARVGTDWLVASVPNEPIWRIGNMARGRYLRDLGNTPGHVSHWSSRAFRRLVASDFEVTELARPLPWTVLAGRRPAAPAIR